jgi:Ni/Co efflux regulator RcnB
VKKMRKALALSTLCLILSGGFAFADDHHDDRHDDHHDDHHDNHHYVHHQEWRKGYRMNHDDWNRGARIDYRRYHLHAPPRGYEWREVDGNYVLAAVATGMISSIIIASAVH